MATYTPVRLAGTALSATTTTYYTSPASTKTIVKQIILCNTSSSVATTATVNLGGNVTLSAVALAASETKVIDLSFVMNAAETITASGGTAVRFTAHGLQVV